MIFSMVEEDRANLEKGIVTNIDFPFQKSKHISNTYNDVSAGNRLFNPNR